MSLLFRYRKQVNGFEQLVHLVESSTPPKQEKFLKLIDAEDSHWGEILRLKMLSLERVFSWEHETLSFVLRSFTGRQLALLLYENKSEYLTTAKELLNELQKEELEFWLANVDFGKSEQVAMVCIFIEKVREMITDEKIHLPSVDPSLIYRNEAA